MNILMIRPLAVCYGATAFYIEKLANELSELEHDIMLFDVIQSPEDRLEELNYLMCDSGEEFDVIFDINSMLTNIKNNDGVPYVEVWNKPFFNYIIDHPVYHHEALSFHYDKYHVITLDDYHTEYVKKYYPHITHVHTMMLTSDAIKNPQINRERHTDVAFIGTYNNPDRMLKAIEGIEDMCIRENIHTLIDYLLTHADCDIGDGIEYMKRVSNRAELSNPGYIANYLFVADSYVRAFQREQLIKTLLESGIRITLAGGGFTEMLEKYKSIPSENATLLEGCSYNKTLDILADSKLALSYNPLFKTAVHDRVFAAAYNGALVVSNVNATLANSSLVGVRYCMGDAASDSHENCVSIEELPDRINKFLKDEDARTTLAKHAYDEAIDSHTFSDRARDLSKIIASYL